MAAKDSIEMEEERLTAEMDFKDSSSVVIKIRRRLPDFLQSVKLKYVKLGYGYSCNYPAASLAMILMIAALFGVTAFQLTGLRFRRFSDFYSRPSLSLIVDTATGVTGLVVLLFFLGIYWARRPRPVFLVDFACYKPEDDRKISVDSFLEMTEENGAFSGDTVSFQKKISYRSGLGDETYLPQAVTARPPNLCMKEARAEAEAVMFGALDSLFEKTGVKPEEIGILIVNCSLFNPTPSLSSMIVNHYKLRENIRSYNLGGMGCSAGLISIDLAKHLLKANPNTYAVVVSMENITLNWYFGNDRSMLLCNCIFRMGGAAMLLSNKRSDRARSKYELIHTVRTHKGSDDNSYNCVYQREDEQGVVGVSLARELMAVAGDALKTNITTLGPLVLPLSEQFKFAVTLIKRKVLKNAKVKPYIPDFKRAFGQSKVQASRGSFRKAMLGTRSALRAARRLSAGCFRRRNPLIAGRSGGRVAAASKVPACSDSDKFCYHSFLPGSAGGFKYSSSLLFSTASMSTSAENGLDENNCGGAADGVQLINSESPAESLSTTSSISDAYYAIDLALDSVVKIFTVSSSPSYFLPWQNKSQRESTGSGFVIPGKRILTNAHVVADHTFVLVRKHGSPTKYRAKVQAVGHECDLAILVVENEEFWEGTNSLELGDIPFLQEAVAVVGYPQGGDNISVTKGVVSRVEPTQYVHGASQLLAIQIDAAINPGNSGGPAIMGNKVAGVAFQNLSGAENIGYIIPVPVIRHFISGVEENGSYVGFCSMGLSCQPTENLQLREYFQMGPELTGVLVSKINPLSDAYKVLRKDDIILSFDGIPIANDGTVHFRNRERITFDHLVSMKKPNETALLKVLRNGEKHEFSIKLFPLKPLVPVHQFDKLPSFFIFAGLVFIPLTQPYLHEYGEDWYNTSPRRLCERALRKLPTKPGEQLVILSQVLLDDINTGYERLAELQVKKVNGIEVENLKHLRKLVEDNSKERIRFDLDDERVIVLNYDLANVATSRILKRHRIPYAMSSDLINDETAPELELACSN